MAAGDVWSVEYRRIGSLLLRWTVPVAILGAFALSGHLGQAISALTDVSLVWALPLVFVGILLPLSHAWRWCFLLSRTGLEIPLAGAARVTALASLVNYAAPGFLGAPAKAILARDSHRVPLSRSLPTLAAEQTLDAVLLAAFGLITAVIAGPVVLSALDVGVQWNQTLLALSIPVLVAIAVVLAWRIGRRLAPGFLAALREASLALIHSPAHRRPILALTAARWMLDMTAVALASVAVGLRLNVLEILLIANLSLLIGLLAPVPGGLGVREAVMASIAGAVGISIPAVLALSVLHRAGLAIGLPLVLGAARLYEWSVR